MFNFDQYIDCLEKSIMTILQRPNKTRFTFDILDTPIQQKYRLIVLRDKQLKMKYGEIWQQILGTYEGYINLKTGHALDIISHKYKIAIELKNRTNTDNSSSKKYNFSKLTAFKKRHPEYRCIYGAINASTESKTFHSREKKMIVDGQEIEYHTGYNFIKLILREDTDYIINFVKSMIIKYVQE